MRTYGESFRHEAVFYDGDDDFVARSASFIRDGIARSEPVLVVVASGKIDALRTELGSEAERVAFADMAEIGRNPALIIPAWRDFVAQQDTPCRGIGEPIWSGRGAAELAECERHEALLNLAFADSPGWWLVCPYDEGSLEPPVLAEARRNHPFVSDRRGRRPSSVYRGLARVMQPPDHPLERPPASRLSIAFRVSDLQSLRATVAEFARAHGLSPRRSEDLVLAVDEIATNSLRHGGGSGVLGVWSQGDRLVCEVEDAGFIVDPLVGRRRPDPHRTNGFGLWLANHLCDLVQIRTSPTGTVVRLHMSRKR